MAKIKFITVKGQGNLAQEPFYIGIPQHERSLSLREAYELCAEHTGYRATAVRAVFKALADRAGRQPRGILRIFRSGGNN